MMMLMNVNVIRLFAVVDEVLCVIILGTFWSSNQNMTLPNPSQITTVKIPQLRVTGATELESELLREICIQVLFCNKLTTIL